MAVKLNEEALKYAKNLIKDGKYVTGTDWSETQPSPEEESDYLDSNDWDAYSKWFLGLNTEDSEDEKGRYEFPYGDFQKVHRSGVIAAKQRAAQYEHTEIEKAADELMDMIDKREEGD